MTCILTLPLNEVLEALVSLGDGKPNACSWSRNRSKGFTRISFVWKDFKGDCVLGSTRLADTRIMKFLLTEDERLEVSHYRRALLHLVRGSIEISCCVKGFAFLFSKDLSFRSSSHGDGSVSMLDQMPIERMHQAKSPRSISSCAGIRNGGQEVHLARVDGGPEIRRSSDGSASSQVAKKCRMSFNSGLTLVPSMPKPRKTCQYTFVFGFSGCSIRSSWSFNTSSQTIMLKGVP